MLGGWPCEKGSQQQYIEDQIQHLLSAHEELSKADKRSLDRRVPTWWNSESNCLEAHLYFQPIVEALTIPTENGLRAYKLTPTQWSLAMDVGDVLEVSNILYHWLHFDSMQGLRYFKNLPISSPKQTSRWFVMSSICLMPLSRHW